MYIYIDMDDINKLIELIKRKQLKTEDIFSEYFTYTLYNDFVYDISKLLNSENKYIKEKLNELNDINIIYEDKNNHRLNLGLLSLCFGTQVEYIWSLFFGTNSFNDSNNKFGRATIGDSRGHVCNLIQKDCSNDIKQILSQESNNIIDNSYFTNTINKYDIIVITLDTYLCFLNNHPNSINNISGYSKVTNKKTNISIYDRMKGFDNIDKNKFNIEQGVINEEEFKSSMKKLIDMYPNQQFILINWVDIPKQYLWSVDGYGYTLKQKADIFKSYNRIICELNNDMNIKSINMNKHCMFDETIWKTDSGIRAWAVPFSIIIKIVIELNEKINQTCLSLNKPFRISQFFRGNIACPISKNDLYLNMNPTNKTDNFKILYINEGNKYITSVIKINNIINDNITNEGLGWIYPFTFLKSYNKDIIWNTNNVYELRTIVHEKYNELLKNIPIIKCKLIFNARTDKYYPNLRLKVWTGFGKWIIINNELNTNYNEFSLETDFHFCWTLIKLGFENIEPNTLIYIYNPYFIFS